MPEETQKKMAWAPLIVLSTALFIIIVDSTLLNVSLRNIITDLNSTTQQVQWVITVYSLILAAFTITGGRLGDIFGRKKMFLLGAIIFALGSLIAAASLNFGTLLVGESIVEGFGAALMMPATASLLLLNYRGRERIIAFAIWGSMAGVAATVGPILGGFLTTNYTWRYGFLINVVVVGFLLYFSKLIKDQKIQGKKLTLDWGGVALSSLGLFTAVYGVIEASTYGWWTKKADFIVGGVNLQIGNISVTPQVVVLGLIILYFFYRWEVRVTKSGKTPLLTLDLFSNKAFIAGVGATSMVSMALMGFAFLMPVFYQAVLGFDAFHSGLANLPLSLALLIVSPLGALLTKKISPKYLVIIGMFMSAIGVFWIGQTFDISNTAASFIAPLAFFGAGMGLVLSQINNLTLSSAPLEEAGEASGVLNTGRQLASALGLAILGTILLAAVPVNLGKEVDASDVIPTQAKTSIKAELAKSSGEIEFRQPTLGPVNATIGVEIERIVKQSITDADRYASFFATFFVIIGIFVAFWLPKQIPEHDSDDRPVVVGH